MSQNQKEQQELSAAKDRCIVSLYSVLLFSVDSRKVSHAALESCCIICDTVENFEYSKKKKKKKMTFRSSIVSISSK